MIVLKNAAVIGAAGAIGSACVTELRSLYSTAVVHAFSRAYPTHRVPHVGYHLMDYHDENAIAKAADLAARPGPIDLVIVTIGALHHHDMMPEKSLNALSSHQLRTFFDINTILPALMIKHFSKKLSQNSRSMIGVLSARVGSISDNRLGGWYAYRASKAALNMIVKTAAIEMARTHQQAILVGLHPGTVDSGLSKPFQKNLPAGQLFTPAYAAKQLIAVLTTRTTAHSGHCFAWDGRIINP